MAFRVCSSPLSMADFDDFASAEAPPAAAEAVADFEFGARPRASGTTLPGRCSAGAHARRAAPRATWAAAAASLAACARCAGRPARARCRQCASSMPLGCLRSAGRPPARLAALCARRAAHCRQPFAALAFARLHSPRAALTQRAPPRCPGAVPAPAPPPPPPAGDDFGFATADGAPQPRGLAARLHSALSRASLTRLALRAPFLCFGRRGRRAAAGALRRRGCVRGGGVAGGPARAGRGSGGARRGPLRRPLRLRRRPLRGPRRSPARAGAALRRSAR
jgi:hypothetical protein